nr:hypothetical protein [Streptomyces kasugaensis]
MEAIGGAVLGELGRLPAVFTADGSEQAPHVVPPPTPMPVGHLPPPGDPHPGTAPGTAVGPPGRMPEHR